MPARGLLLLPAVATGGSGIAGDPREAEGGSEGPGDMSSTRPLAPPGTGNPTRTREVPVSETSAILQLPVLFPVWLPVPSGVGGPNSGGLSRSGCSGGRTRVSAKFGESFGVPHDSRTIAAAHSIVVPAVEVHRARTDRDVPRVMVLAASTEVDRVRRCCRAAHVPEEAETGRAGRASQRSAERRVDAHEGVAKARPFR
jgi:hypothetical protein